MNMRDEQLIKAVIAGVAPVVREYVENEVGKAIARIRELEQRPTLRYAGVYAKTTSYGAGAAVTHHGSLWIAKCVTMAEPGSGSTDWQLAVKRGRDGKDAEARSPTMQRGGA